MKKLLGISLALVMLIGSIPLGLTAYGTHDPNFNHPTPFGAPDAELENVRITMTLDQETYKKGETIKISGNIGIKDSESLAIITLFKPDGTVVTSTQMMPNNDGIVSYQFKAGSGNMDVSGKYTIKIEYGHNSIAKVFFFNVVEDVTQMKTVGDDALFFGIFVYIDNLFSWIVGK